MSVMLCLSDFTVSNIIHGLDFLSGILFCFFLLTFYDVLLLNMLHVLDIPYTVNIHNHFNFGYSVLFTGLSSEEKLHGVKYIIESFVGCIRNVVLSAGKAASDLLPITPLIATKHENVKEGCFNKCHSRHNLCFDRSRCINHYYDITCDCFGTHYEGEQCDTYSK